MRVLIDTNVLLDFVLDREEFLEDATATINKCADDEGAIEGFVSAHSIMDMCYFLKGKKTREEIIDILKQLCTILTVVETTKDRILAAAERMDFKDLEDSVVNQAAIRCNADYIVTRDVRHGHFKTADAPVISPPDFLKLFEEDEDIQ